MLFEITVCNILVLLAALTETTTLVQGGDSNPSSPHLSVRKRPRLDLNKLPSEQGDIFDNYMLESTDGLLAVDDVQRTRNADLAPKEQSDKKMALKAFHRSSTARWYANLTPEQKKERQQKNSTREKINYTKMVSIVGALHVNNLPIVRFLFLFLLD